MEQNLCPNCSKPVLDTEEICPNCGAIIGAKMAKPLNKRAIQSKPQNMMAASPKKARPRGSRPVSPRAQTEVSPGGPRRQRPPQGQGRPTQGGQQRPKRRPSGQYMHSPDSRYGEGIERPTRGQMLERKTDYTTIIVIAAFVIAIIVTVIVMSSDTKAEGGLKIEKVNGEVLSNEEINPVMKLVQPEPPRIMDDHLEVVFMTEGQLSEPQCQEVISYYNKLFSTRESAVETTGSDLIFQEWQELGGKLKYQFIRRVDKNFRTYKVEEFTINNYK